MTTDVPETLSRVQADPALLERAVANVADNALAWSPPGEPVHLAASEAAGRVELRIVDRGPGLPAEGRERVFEPFQRFGDRPHGEGIGLGLAVAKGFVEAMGGHHRTGGHPGRGPHRVHLPGGGMTRVLVVDDEPQIRRALSDQPAGTRLRGGCGRLRRRGPAAGGGPRARRGGPRPGAAGDRWSRSDPRPAGLDAGSHSRALGPRPGTRQGGGPRRRGRRLRHQAFRHGGVARPAAGGPAPCRAGRRGRLAGCGGDARLRARSGREAGARGGEEIRLTPTEWHLVEVLVRHPGRLVGQRQLLQEVWGPQYETETNYLRVFMAQVRRKLEPDQHHNGYHPLTSKVHCNRTRRAFTDQQDHRSQSRTGLDGSYR